MNMDRQWMAGVRSVLHGQVSLAAVNQICVIQEAMNGCKIHKACFENVNITLYLLLTFSRGGGGSDKTK